MQEEEYTFVTLDNDDMLLSDAIVVDVDGDFELDAVVIDDSIDGSDFITLSDDTIMLADTDMDIHMSDIDGADISFMI